jgi:hypothetical protein
MNAIRREKYHVLPRDTNPPVAKNTPWKPGRGAGGAVPGSCRNAAGIFQKPFSGTLENWLHAFPG